MELILQYSEIKKYTAICKPQYVCVCVYIYIFEYETPTFHYGNSTFKKIQTPTVQGSFSLLCNFSNSTFFGCILLVYAERSLSILLVLPYSHIATLSAPLE
jgi:hypothetical protein